MNFTHRQCRPAIHRSIDCLCRSIAGFKTSLHAAAGCRPCGARSVSFKEPCDFLFGQIGAVYMGIAFRNASVISKRHQVHISTLNVNDADRSVIAQASLSDCAIRIFNPVTVIAEVCRGRACDCANREDQGDREFHPFHSASLHKSATMPFVVLQNKAMVRIIAA